MTGEGNGLVRVDWPHRQEDDEIRLGHTVVTHPLRHLHAIVEAARGRADAQRANDATHAEQLAEEGTRPGEQLRREHLALCARDHIIPAAALLLALFIGERLAVREAREAGISLELADVKVDAQRLAARRLWLVLREELVTPGGEATVLLHRSPRAAMRCHIGAIALRRHQNRRGAAIGELAVHAVVRVLRRRRQGRGHGYRDSRSCPPRHRMLFSTGKVAQTALRNS